MTRILGLQICPRFFKAFLVLGLFSLVFGYGCSGFRTSHLNENERGDVVSGNERFESFRRSKKLVYELHLDSRRTFYCDCPYEGVDIDLKACSFRPTKAFGQRATRTEIEHVVPAFRFGQSFPEWRDGHLSCTDSKGKRFRGRRCATKLSKSFRLMASDLYNLRPVNGGVNALRGHLRMGMVDGEDRHFGSCDLEVSRTSKRFEPRDDIRGDIARTYFYMDAAYPHRGILGDSQRKLMLAWHRLDPVSEAEFAWAKRVEALQGNTNPFVLSGMEPK